MGEIGQRQKHNKTQQSANRVRNINIMAQVITAT